jgi:hypothetical protein
VSRRGTRRPTVSTLGALEAVAAKFCPPYRVGRVEPRALSITLEDPGGARPDIRLRHVHERRLFFRANYLVVDSSVPGSGPDADGILRFRFRGPIGRQRGRMGWRQDVPGGQAWADRLREPLMRGMSEVEGIESVEIRWTAKKRRWQLRLKTLSGSMVGGFMIMMPIPIPMEPSEARGIITMIDALAQTRS